MQDLVAGQIDLLFDTLRTSLPLMRAGNIKAYVAPARKIECGSLSQVWLPRRRGRSRRARSGPQAIPIDLGFSAAQVR
jgi:hypothetical protein